jgi:hypothetical protein
VWLLLDNGSLVGTLLSPAGARQLRRDETDLQIDTTLELDLHLVGLPSRSTRVLIRDILHLPGISTGTN